MKTLLKKKKDRAFGKDIYLLGIDSEGQNVWLEAPSWDCGWYWGFGYVERYTNNRQPSMSKDIQSHTHIDSEFMKNGIINVNEGLARTVYTKEQGIVLNGLFTKFYALRKHAEKNKEKAKKINEVEIPAITGKIIKILS